jgi:hypothetical protein
LAGALVGIGTACDWQAVASITALTDVPAIRRKRRRESRCTMDPLVPR